MVGREAGVGIRSAATGSICLLRRMRSIASNAIAMINATRNAMHQMHTESEPMNQSPNWRMRYVIASASTSATTATASW